MLGTLMERVDYSMLKRLQDDAGRNRGKLSELKKLEEVTDEIISGKRDGIRKEHYLYKVAKRVRSTIKKEESKSKQKGAQKIAQVRKEEQRLQKERREAAEMTGQRK
jgi:vacuolar-type H+-ATPase subunit I/STV1